MMRRGRAPMQPDSGLSYFLATSRAAPVTLQLCGMSNAADNRIERRCGQRFPYQIPITLRVPEDGRSGAGFTQDLSSRGALVWTDLPLTEGALVELTLVMPSEITLADDMSVCCRARVVRLEHCENRKPAVAIKIEHYDFPHHEVPVLQQHTSRDEQPEPA